MYIRQNISFAFINKNTDFRRAKTIVTKKNIYPKTDLIYGFNRQ
jgi:hypothetical protein